MNGQDIISQSEERQSIEGRDRTTDKRQEQFHDRSETSLRYFSMFTGVGGFELGLQGAFGVSTCRESEQDKDTEDKSNSSGIEQKRQYPSNHNGSSRITEPPNSGSKRFSSRFECIGFSEIDKYASQLLAKRFPDVPNFGDATKIDPGRLPDFDMLCGGFPCQAFSIAGKRKGFEDTRGTMFFEVARIVEVKRPKLVFLENVKGLLNHNKGQTFSVILQTLEELGYDVQWMVLNSKFHGVPQNRERVFIIGSLRGQPRPEILPFREHGQEDLELQRQQAITNTITRNYEKGQATGSYITEREQLPQVQAFSNVYGGFGEERPRESNISPTIRTPKGGGHLPMIAQRIPLRFLERNQKNIEGDWAFTVDSTNTGGVMTVANCVTPDAYLQKGERKRVDGKAILTSVHERRIRRLTPLECERLQGFPDGWTSGFSDTQRYKMMGNAVTVNVISAIARRLLPNV